MQEPVDHPETDPKGAAGSGRNRLNTRGIQSRRLYWPPVLIAAGVILTLTATMALVGAVRATSLDIADVIGEAAVLVIIVTLLGLSRFRRSGRFERYAILAASALVSVGFTLDVFEELFALPRQLSLLENLAKLLGILLIGLSQRRFVRTASDQIAGLSEEADRMRVDLLRDPLTGLINRRGLEERVESLLRQRTPFAVALIDLDDFKRINDTYGHLIGDRTLQHVARVLRDCTREREHDALHRIGGEEFVIVLANVTPVEMATLCERILRTLRASPLRERDIAFAISASIGVSMNDGTTAPELTINEADAAMYLAKRRGKDRAVVFGAETP